MLPLTLTPTTLGFDEEAVYVSASLSGSLKYEDTSTDPLSPFLTVAFGIVFTFTGVPFTTTITLTLALPPQSSSTLTVR